MPGIFSIKNDDGVQFGFWYTIEEAESAAHTISLYDLNHNIWSIMDNDKGEQEVVLSRFYVGDKV